MTKRLPNTYTLNKIKLRIANNKICDFLMLKFNIEEDFVIPVFNHLPR